ncbi:unnamed protein product [Litomosoides sigmodontis]|uniref:C2H2-type domain-containing protein n=1 Tax=Litomosoides sigmodontis TaxID=42156 RepID=A0A3P6RYZ0_LITSI|nr:unnamed protein product [Litomosoides sigmodontis]
MSITRVVTDNGCPDELRWSGKRSMANFFLCYECGATFSVRSDFDEHILVHQAVSLCYQIYEFDKGGPSVTRVPSVVKAKEESQHTSSSKESFKPQTVKLSTVLRKTSSDSQRNARKATGTKRKLTDPSLPYDKGPCLKQRKNSQNDVKITKANKAQDNPGVVATSNSHAVQPQMDKEFSKMGLDDQKNTRKASSTDILATEFPADTSGHIDTDLAESQTTNLSKVIEPPPKTDVSMAVATTSTGNTIPSSLSTSLTTTAPRYGGSGTAPTLPKCLNCDYRSSQGTDMVEHDFLIHLWPSWPSMAAAAEECMNGSINQLFIVVRVHKTSITSLERVDFLDGKWSEAVKLEPRQQCAYCVRTFREVTDYFLHVITCHKRNLLLPGVSKYNCIVYLAHPGMPTHMVRIFMKRP